MAKINCWNRRELFILLFTFSENVICQKRKLSPTPKLSSTPTVGQVAEQVSNSSSSFLYPTITLVIFVGIILFIFFRWKKRKLLKELISEEHRKISPLIETSFLVRACPSCQEFKMQLIEISPNARSIHYSCIHCGKKLRDEAGTPKSQNIIPLLNNFYSLSEQYNAISKPIKFLIRFRVPASPLPYEQTSRSSIPQPIKNEVWRRDKGCCVQCGARENLEYDHIIPVSKGGATSVRNLQLLCMRCNRSKSNKI